jgi:hypothetical protein
MIMASILIDLFGEDLEEEPKEKKELKSKPEARPLLPLRKQVINIDGEVVDAP